MNFAFRKRVSDANERQVVGETITQLNDAAASGDGDDEAEIIGETRVRRSLRNASTTLPPLEPHTLNVMVDQSTIANHTRTGNGLVSVELLLWIDTQHIAALQEIHRLNTLINNERLKHAEACRPAEESRLTYVEIEALLWLRYETDFFEATLLLTHAMLPRPCIRSSDSVISGYTCAAREREGEKFGQDVLYFSLV